MKEDLRGNSHTEMQITLFDSWTSGDRRLSYSSQSPLDWILEVTSQKTKLLEFNTNRHIKGLPQVTEKQVSFNFIYMQSFKQSCRMLSNRFLHIAHHIVCKLYWTYLGIVFVCLCLCSVDWLLFVLIWLKRQNTSTSLWHEWLFDNNCSSAHFDCHVLKHVYFTQNIPFWHFTTLHSGFSSHNTTRKDTKGQTVLVCIATR